MSVFVVIITNTNTHKFFIVGVFNDFASAKFAGKARIAWHKQNHVIDIHEFELDSPQPKLIVEELNTQIAHFYFDSIVEDFYEYDSTGVHIIPGPCYNSQDEELRLIEEAKIKARQKPKRIVSELTTKYKLDEIPFKSNSRIELYCCGYSKELVGKGSWGIILKLGSKEFEFSGIEQYSTINRLDLIVAIKALELVNQPVKTIVLMTNSEYVHLGITSWVNKWKRNNWLNNKNEPVKNQDLWELLYNLNCNKNVAWVLNNSAKQNQFSNKALMLAQKV